jgi:hypothetical protein
MVRGLKPITFPGLFAPSFTANYMIVSQFENPVCEETTWDRWEDNIKMDTKEMSCEDVEKIELDPMTGFCDGGYGFAVYVKGNVS